MSVTASACAPLSTTNPSAPQHKQHNHNHMPGLLICPLPAICSLALPCAGGGGGGGVNERERVRDSGREREGVRDDGEGG